MNRHINKAILCCLRLWARVQQTVYCLTKINQKNGPTGKNSDLSDASYCDKFTTLILTFAGAVVFVHLFAHC